MYRERRRKEEKGPVGMAKDFDFQMLAIYVMFKLTIQVASITTTANLTQNFTAAKLENLSFSKNYKVCQFIIYVNITSGLLCSQARCLFYLHQDIMRSSSSYNILLTPMVTSVLY